MHRCAPEVVEKDISQWTVRPEIAILLDRTDVVENEAAVERVVEAENADKCDDGRVDVWSHYVIFFFGRTWRFFNDDQNRFSAVLQLFSCVFVNFYIFLFYLISSRLNRGQSTATMETIFVSSGRLTTWTRTICANFSLDFFFLLQQQSRNCANPTKRRKNLIFGHFSFSISSFKKHNFFFSLPLHT